MLPMGRRIASDGWKDYFQWADVLMVDNGYFITRMRDWFPHSFYLAILKATCLS